MVVGVVEEPGAAGQVPFAPRRDHLDVGSEGVIAELEADLIIALAGRAMRNRVGADLACDLDLALGDQRPCDRGAEQIGALVERIGAEHRIDEIPHELLAQILDKDLGRAQQFRLASRRLQFFALTQIGGEGDDLDSGRSPAASAGSPRCQGRPNRRAPLCLPGRPSPFLRLRHALFPFDARARLFRLAQWLFSRVAQATTRFRTAAAAGRYNRVRIAGGRVRRRGGAIRRECRGPVAACCCRGS